MVRQPLKNESEILLKLNTARHAERVSASASAPASFP